MWTPEQGKSIESIVGYSVQEVTLEEFRRRYQNLREALAELEYPPSALGYIGFPMSSEWVSEKEEVGRYTDEASACVAGIAFDEKGAAKIFHYFFFSDVGDVHRDIESDKAVAGFYSSGYQVVRGNRTVVSMYEGMGLSLIQPPEDKDIDEGRFGILLDIVNGEIIYYFEEVINLR